MTSLTYNVSSDSFNEAGITGRDNNAVPDSGVATATDHTKVAGINMAQEAPNTTLYFKHATSERQISASEAAATNATVSINGMQTDFRSAVAAGLITDTGEMVGATPARTEPASQPTGEGMEHIGDEVSTGISEDASAALGLVNATIESESLVDMVLSASDSGEFDLGMMNQFNEAMGADSSSMANHLLDEGLSAFETHFGTASDMAMDYCYQNRDTPEVREAIAAFIGGRGMSGFQQIFNNM